MHADEYRKLAETEDRMWYFRALHRRLEYWLKRYLPDGRRRVLDAGCGTGGFLRHLEAAGHGWELTGLDISPIACALARPGAHDGENPRELDHGTAVLGRLPRCDRNRGCALSHRRCGARARRIRALPQTRGSSNRERAGLPVALVVPRHRRRIETPFRPDRSSRALLPPGGELGGQMFASYANLFALPFIVARRKLFPPTASDERRAVVYPWPVEAMFTAMAWLEHLAVGCGLPLPAGSSVVVVGDQTGEVATVLVQLEAEVPAPRGFELLAVPSREGVPASNQSFEGFCRRAGLSLPC